MNPTTTTPPAIRLAALVFSALFLTSPLSTPDSRADDKKQEGDDKKEHKQEEMTPIEPKVKICHNGHTITVSLAAVSAHLKHGDTLGECKEKDDDKEKGKGKEKDKD